MLVLVVEVLVVDVDVVEVEVEELVVEVLVVEVLVVLVLKEVLDELEEVVDVDVEVEVPIVEHHQAVPSQTHILPDAGSKYHSPGVGLVGSTDRDLIW